ncbi:MAG TPA: hypothetical protein PLQ97_09950 [Myxococcota bacterium]|nr:hypothetical protein [Myxococcota bacterium]HQK51201.1 hypothetical protein [Myxococcota bacterium]
MDERDLPAVGSKLVERYRLAFGRGEGPSGYVFKALDLALDLPVAVKVFRRDLFTSPFREQNLRRLYRARTFQDPAVCRILEVQEDAEGRHFLTSTLMEGMSLRQVIDIHAESGESFPLPKVRNYAQRLFDAVLAIHRAGAIHGNIKPENFFVQPDRIVTTDPYHLVLQPLAEGEQIPVSDYYRGPEQLSQPELEFRQSDVHSLALVLGEILAVSPVQPGVPLSAQVPRLTRRLDDLFVAATAADPAQRPSTVEEFASEFLRVLKVIESEGLWQRRSHETGSFRAIRLQVGEESGLTPLPVELAPAPAAQGPAEVPAEVPPVSVPAPGPRPEEAPAVAAAPSAPVAPTEEEPVTTPVVPEAEPAPETPPRPEAPPEVSPAPEEAPTEVLEVAEAVPSAVAPEEEETVVMAASAPEPSPQPPPEETWDEDKTVVAPMVFPAQEVVAEPPPPPPVPPPVPEEEILELEEEVIEVAGASGEEVLEEIDLVEEEPSGTVPSNLPPEAPAGTLEMESAIPEPTKPLPMAPFGRVENLPGTSKRSKRKAAKAARQAAREPSKAAPVPAPAARPPEPPKAPEPSRAPEPPRPSSQASGAPARPTPATPPMPPSRTARRPASGAKEGGSKALVTFLVLLAIAVALAVAAVILWPGDREPSIPAEPPVAQAPKAPAPVAKVEPPPPPAPKPPEVPAPAAVGEPAPAAAPEPASAPAPVPAAAAVPATPVPAAPEAPAAPPPVPPPPPAPPPAPALKCPAGMVLVTWNPNPPAEGKPADVAFCMDAYEFPGQGEKPRTGVNAGTAAGLCRKAGKRLCTGREFLKACGDASFEAGVCNTSGSIQPSGAFPSCKSPQGIYDLVGNAGEWTADGQLRGGDASRGGNGTCGYATRRFSPKATDGFRCCADPTR